MRAIGMNIGARLGILTVSALLGCQQPADDAGQQQAVAAHAAELATRYAIVDTHIDAPTRVHRSKEDLARGSEGQFDIPRARRGGLDVAFMSIYIPARVDVEGEGAILAHALIDIVEELVARAPDKVALAYSVADVERNFKAGLISLPLGMENGGPIGAEFEHLGALYDRGIRYVTPAHSRSNVFSDSSYDVDERWQGLSPAGRDLVAKLNEIGIMIDVSHLSDKAFWQVLELTRTPVIASHSATRRFVPGFHRNIDDNMIRAMGENGGVVQINFGSSYVSAESRRSGEASRTALQQFMKRTGHAGDSEEAREFFAGYRSEHPYRRASVAEVLDHFDHVVELAGVDHVGIGSDYDGVGDTLPIGLEDVSTYPNLIEGLIARGYSDADIEKMLGGNLLRVWRAVERHSAVRHPVERDSAVRGSAGSHAVEPYGVEGQAKAHRATP